MKRNTLVALFVCFALVTAGCGTSQTTDASTATNTAESSPTPTAPTPPTSTDGTPDTGTETPTTTPDELQQGGTYTTRFIRLLDSDSVDISELNVSYNGSEYDATSFDFKSADLETYGKGTQKRLRINISVSSLGNLTRMMNETFLLYAHILESAHRNGDTPAFDEVELYPHQDNELVGRNLMNEYMVQMYLEGFSTSEFMVKEWTYKTSILYQNGSFGDGASPELRSRIQDAATPNMTILRTDQIGGMVLVDYATKTHPDNGARRTAQIAKLTHAYGQSIANTELNADSYSVIIEERYITENGTHDVRGWTTINQGDASAYAEGQISAGEILNIVENRYLYEDDYLGR